MMMSHKQKNACRNACYWKMGSMPDGVTDKLTALYNRDDLDYRDVSILVGSMIDLHCDRLQTVEQEAKRWAEVESILEKYNVKA